jgi:hypothetical protein
MHYGVLVILDEEYGEESRDSAGLDADVEQALARFRESEWDWYQIGGRWTGHFDGYEPHTDPVNLDEAGKEKWPIDWKSHAGDVIPVEQLTARHLEDVWAFVIGGCWHGGQDYFPWRGENGNGQRDVKKMFVKRERPPLEWIKRECAGHTVVIVDCHN